MRVGLVAPTARKDIRRHLPVLIPATSELTKVTSGKLTRIHPRNHAADGMRAVLMSHRDVTTFMRATLITHEVRYVKSPGRAIASNTRDTTTGETVKMHRFPVAATIVATDATFIAGLFVLPMLTAV